MEYFTNIPYTKPTLYLHALQKFTFSDNDYESIQKKKKTKKKQTNNKQQDTKKIKIMEYSTPLNASKQKREKALVTDEAWLAETSKYGPCFFFWIEFLLLKELFKIYF